MLPPEMIKPVIVAGIFLGIMSIVDTLAYGVRTAGVITKRLAIALSLFNILVIFSRLSNMVQAPILGNFPDKVFKEIYTPEQVLIALRYDLLFVIGGVLIGGALTPTFIRMTSRGITILNEKGSFIPTMMHGLGKIWRLPQYFQAPTFASFRRNLDFRTIPMNFLVFNVFVTCFYSIGVMSTILAASWDHSLAVTMALLSGIVNGIASMLLFTIVDPPAAVVIDQCIAGNRPESHAKTMNIYLVITRLLGCVLALAMLPPMARYVQNAAYWLDNVFYAEQQTVEQETMLYQSSTSAAGLEHKFTLSQREHELILSFEVSNTRAESQAVSYNSGERVDFTLESKGEIIWRANDGKRFTQAIETITLSPLESADWEEVLPLTGEIEQALESGTAEFRAEHKSADGIIAVTIRYLMEEE